MYNRNIKNIYQENQILMASPKQLIVLLYDGCIKQLKLAEFALAEKKFDEVNANLIKAQNIVQELKNTLNHAEGGEVAQNLDELYNYILSGMIQANVSKDAMLIRKYRGMIEDLRETWIQI